MRSMLKLVAYLQNDSTPETQPYGHNSACSLSCGSTSPTGDVCCRHTASVRSNPVAIGGTPDMPLTRRVCRFDYGVAPPGRRTVKTEPLPGSLVTVTSPPIMRA